MTRSLSSSYKGDIPEVEGWYKGSYKGGISETGTTRGKNLTKGGSIGVPNKEVRRSRDEFPVELVG